MPTYKLIYFTSSGRAEISRYLFALAGIEYEDKRIDLEEWAELKKTLPFGYLPVLEVDGVMISQTFAIARFIAKRAGLLGKGDIQEALADSIVLATGDVFTAIQGLFLEKNQDKQVELQKKFLDETAPDILSKLEKIVSDNSSGYLVGDELTWADVVVFDLISGWIRVYALSHDYFSNYPQLLSLETKISNLPQIASWIAKRPARPPDFAQSIKSLVT